MLSRTPRTVLGVLVHRVRSGSGAYGSCPWSGDAGAVSLALVAGSGLGGPMPVHIALVCTGRCRPSPDLVSEGAPADGHRGGGVSAGLAGFAGEGGLPVLGAPDAGVGGVDGDHADAGFRAHGQQAGAQAAGGGAGDELPESLAAGGVFAGGGGGGGEVFRW